MARIDAYAYYLTTYGNTAPSRYDSHKKSDLRKVYNHMVKTNKESPLYKLSSANEVTRYAIDIKENAKSIQHVVASLSDSYGTFADSFRKKVAESSDESSVGVKYIGDGKEGNEVEAFDIEVKRLSSPQINLGNYLPNDEHSLEPGTYSFDINTSNASYEYQFTVKPSENNITILKKLANLINNSTVGITASIHTYTSEDETTHACALGLTSKQTGINTGETSIFDITPGLNSASKEALEILGIDEIYRTPENSLFVLNGEEFSSLSNTFTINDTFELSLNGVSTNGQPAHINFKADVDAVADNINSLLDAFNGILHVAENSSTKATGETNKLLLEMSAMSRARRESLSQIGLSVADNGVISLDKEVLSEAITPENAENTFDILSRFKSAIGTKADNVAINPMHYVNKIVVSYKNPGKTWPAPYFSSVYSGMMLDRYV